MKTLAGIVAFLAGIFFLIYFIMTFGWVSLAPSEVGVRKHLTRGVIDEIYPAGTSHQFNNFWWDVYKANIGIQKITFDDQNQNHEAEYPRVSVVIGEGGGQKAEIALSVNYSLNPNKIVELYKEGIGESYESVLLKREIVDIVNEIARPYPTALTIYSGTGFVEFKQKVELAMKQDKTLTDSGIDISNTIVYNVHLDPAYESEIAGKQIAIQQRLRKEQEKLAAEEEAKKVFAQSEAKVQSSLQEANAEKNRIVTAATAKKEADLIEASGIIAKGEAEAKVAALQRESLYAGESGAWRAKVEIETNRAKQFVGLFKDATIIPEKSILQYGSKLGALTLDADQQEGK